MNGMNWHGIAAIYQFEIARFGRTIATSLLTPVITTSLYFIVFGSAIGSKITTVDGVPYGAFIVPGLIMLSMLTEGIGNASFGIYMPKWSGTIYELLSAPVSPMETVITSSGTICNCSKLFAQMPSTKPNRQKVIAVSSMKPIIASGCAIGSATNKCAVAKITSPRIIDLVAAAPT